MAPTKKKVKNVARLLMSREIGKPTQKTIKRVVKIDENIRRSTAAEDYLERVIKKRPDLLNKAVEVYNKAHEGGAYKKRKISPSQPNIHKTPFHDWNVEGVAGPNDNLSRDQDRRRREKHEQYKKEKKKTKSK